MVKGSGEPDEKQLEEEAEKEEEPATEAEMAEPQSEEEISDTASEAESDVAVEADPLDQLKEELAQARDDHLRLAAEFDNYRKRMAREFGNLVKTANEGLLVNLLEIIDNYSRALESGENKPDFKSYHKGMKLIYEQMIDVLSREGLTRFDSLGEKFDPALHEAVMQVESDEYDADCVAQELAPGYKLHDKVIRHARVAVAKHGEGK